MDGLLPEHVSRWVRDVDAASGGDGLDSSGGSDGDAAWGRVLSGVFAARVLAAEEAHEGNQRDGQSPVTPKGLLVHARSDNACFYNWTRVVFPRAEKSGALKLTAADKSGALAGDPSVLAAITMRLYGATHKNEVSVAARSSDNMKQRGSIRLSGGAERSSRLDAKSHSRSPQSTADSPTSLLQRPKLSRLDRLNRLMARSQKRADDQKLLEKMLASTSPVFAQKNAEMNRKKHNGRRKTSSGAGIHGRVIADDIAYVTDGEVDALDAAVKKLLKQSRAEHEEDFKLLRSKTAMPAEDHNHDRISHSEIKREDRASLTPVQSQIAQSKIVQDRRVQNKREIRGKGRRRKPTGRKQQPKKKMEKKQKLSQQQQQQQQHQHQHQHHQQQQTTYPDMAATTAFSSPAFSSPTLSSPALEMARQKVSLLPRLVRRSNIANDSKNNDRLHRSSSSSEELAAKLDLAERMLRPSSAAAFADASLLLDEEDPATLASSYTNFKAVGQHVSNQRSELPTLSQLWQLQKECLVQPHQVASANKVVSCITAAFFVLERLITMPVNNDLENINDGSGDSTIQDPDDGDGMRPGTDPCSAKDAPDLFRTLGAAFLFFRSAVDNNFNRNTATRSIPAKIEHSIDLIRSHIGINMTSLLQRRIAEHDRIHSSKRTTSLGAAKNRDTRFKKGAPPRLIHRHSRFRERKKHFLDAYLPLDDLAEQLCDAIGSGSDQWWKTLAEDLRLLDALLNHPNISLSTILRACDLLSELWLTDAQWCRPTGDMLAQTVVHYLPFRTMKMWVMRLANVALGLYIEDAKHILLTGRVPQQKKRNNGNVVIASSGVGLVASNGDTLSQRQLCILEFFVRILCCDGKDDVLRLSLAINPGGSKTAHTLREALNIHEAVPGAAIREELGSVILSALETLARVCKEHRESLAHELRTMGVLGVVAEADSSEFFVVTTEENRPACVKRLGMIAGWIGSVGSGSVVGDDRGERLMSTISGGFGSMLDRALRDVESQGSSVLSDVFTPMGTTPTDTPKETARIVTPAFSARSDIHMGPAAQDYEDNARSDKSPALLAAPALPERTGAVSNRSASRTSPTLSPSAPRVERQQQEQEEAKQGGMPPNLQSLSAATRRQRVGTRLSRYLSEIVFPSFGIKEESTGLRLENFHVLLVDVLPESCTMTMGEARRFLKYVDKSETESVSKDALVRFMSTGLLLNQAKRIVYARKSDMHMKIMKFLEEMWANSLKLDPPHSLPAVEI